MTRKLILVDMDGVLADFEKGFADTWKEKMPERAAVPLAARRSFYVRDDYPAELRDQVESIYLAPGFYRSLPLINGAVEAVRELVGLGHDLRICTSPLTQYRNCVLEKYEWVEENLGMDYVGRMIVTKDKTLISGDVLVDDKPEIGGVRAPSWKHVIFDQPYNRQVAGPRVHWSNWREILPAALAP